MNGIFGSFSLVELVIFGFIGANGALCATYFIQHSLRRLAAEAAEK